MSATTKKPTAKADYTSSTSEISPSKHKYWLGHWTSKKGAVAKAQLRGCIVAKSVNIRDLIMMVSGRIEDTTSVTREGRMRSNAGKSKGGKWINEQVFNVRSLCLFGNRFFDEVEGTNTTSPDDPGTASARASLLVAALRIYGITLERAAQLEAGGVVSYFVSTTKQRIASVSYYDDGEAVASFRDNETRTFESTELYSDETESHGTAARIAQFLG